MSVLFDMFPRTAKQRNGYGYVSPNWSCGVRSINREKIKEKPPESGGFSLFASFIFNLPSIEHENKPDR